MTEPILPLLAGPDDETCQIRLSELVPPPCFDCDVHCLRLLPIEVDSDWQELRKPWHNFRLGVTVCPQLLHDNTVADLSLCCCLDELPYYRDLHAYTDGSAKNGVAGWAVVILQWDFLSGRAALVGGFGGNVVTDTEDDRFVGPATPDARAAELSAIVWILLWLIGNKDLMNVWRMTIHFDSTSAGFAASGDWNLGDGTLASKARHLSQACEALWGRGTLNWRHVKGHSGQPWNEFADSLADLFRRQIAAGISAPSLPSGVRIGVLDISRLHLLAQGCDSLAYPKVSNGVANWPETDGRLTEMRPEQIVDFCDDSTVRPWRLQLRCLTANLQSAVGKAPFLEQQLEAAGIQIAFFQEMKAPGGLLRSKRFLRFASDPDQHWGVAVWISRTLPLGWCGRNPVFIEESGLNVVSQGPRHLVITGVFRGRICLSSVHYPQQGRSPEERRALQDLLDPVWDRYGHDVAITGCDANARVPLRYRAVSGGQRFDTPDELGFQLCEGLSRLSW